MQVFDMCASKKDLQKNLFWLDRIESIDNSIRGILKELTALGYLTYCSCSGIKYEHFDKPHWKYFLEHNPEWKFNLTPSVNIYVYSYRDIEILMKLKYILYGTGWNVMFVSDGYREVELKNGKLFEYPKERVRYWHGKYTPILIEYDSDRDDNTKLKAWKILIRKLREYEI